MEGTSGGVCIGVWADHTNQFDTLSSWLHFQYEGTTFKWTHGNSITQIRLIKQAQQQKKKTLFSLTRTVVFYLSFFRLDQLFAIFLMANGFLLVFNDESYLKTILPFLTTKCINLNKKKKKIILK